MLFAQNFYDFESTSTVGKREIPNRFLLQCRKKNYELCMTQKSGIYEDLYLDFIEFRKDYNFNAKR